MPACRAAGRELLRALLGAGLFPSLGACGKPKAVLQAPSFGPSAALCHRRCARGLLGSASLHNYSHDLRIVADAVLLNICIAHTTYQAA